MGKHEFRTWLDHLKDMADCRRVALALALPGRGKRLYCPNCQPGGGKTPDLATYDTGFKCFKCGLSGDSIALVELATGWRFQESAEWLARLCGYVLPKGWDSSERLAREPRQKSAWVQETAQSSATLAGLSHRSEVLETFLKQCPKPEGEVLQQLLDRGIDPAVLDQLNVRWCDERYSMIAYSIKAQFGKPAVLESGLFCQGHTISVPTFWRYHSQRVRFLIFPYVRSGQMLFLKARALAEKSVLESKGLPRFISTSNPVPCPYNADELDKSDKDAVLICEGETDTLTALSRGFRAVGIPGWGGFKREWTDQFANKMVYLVLDSDSAGRKGAEDIAEKFAWAGLNPPSRIELPPQMDLNDYFRPPDQRDLDSLIERMRQTVLTFDGKPFACKPRIGRLTGRIVYNGVKSFDFPQSVGDPRLNRIGPSKPGARFIQGQFRQLLPRIVLETLRRHPEIRLENEDHVETKETLIAEFEPILTSFLAGDPLISPQVESAIKRQPQLAHWLKAAKQLRDWIAAQRAPQAEFQTITGRIILASYDPETHFETDPDPITWAASVLDRLIRASAADIINRASVWIDRSLQAEDQPARVAFIWHNEVWIETTPQLNPQSITSLEKLLKTKMTAAAVAERLQTPVAVQTRE